MEDDCDPDDLVGDVVGRVRDRTPSAKRATVVLGRKTDLVRFAILDWCLSDPIQLEEYQQEPVSIFSRETGLNGFIDGSSNFMEALRRFVTLNPEMTRRTAVETKRTWHLLRPDQQLLVLDGGQPFGAMRAEHFQTVPVRLAILSFLLELEEAIEDRASFDPHAAFACLSADRLKAAEERVRSSNHRYRLQQVPGDMTKMAVESAPGMTPSSVADANPSPPRGDVQVPLVYRAMFPRTMFCDKLTIARKMGWCSSRLSGARGQSLIKRLEDVRNWCAHTGTGSSTIFMEDLFHTIPMTFERWQDPTTGEIFVDDLLLASETARGLVLELQETA